MSGNIGYLMGPSYYKAVTASADDVPQKDDVRGIMIKTDVSALVASHPTLGDDGTLEAQTFGSLTAGTFIFGNFHKVTTVTGGTVSLVY